MTNNIQEQCSCLVDGELNESDCCMVLDEIGDDEELKQDLHRYYLIRDALQNNLPGSVNTKFSQSVMQALESEPTVLAPTKTSESSHAPSFATSTQNKNVITRFPFSKRLASLAIAASVASIAVFTFTTTNNIQQPTDQLAKMPDISEFIRLSETSAPVQNPVAAAPGKQNQLSKNVLVSQALRSTPIDENTSRNVYHNQKIQKYIINHNHHVTSSRLQGAMPYARIVVTKTNQQEHAKQ